MKKRMAVGRVKESLQLLSLMLPGFIVIFLFSYLPLFGVIISFQDYTPAAGILSSNSAWVGLKHFTRFLSGHYFPRLLGNTLRLSLSSFIFGFWPPIALALLLNEIKAVRFKKIVQTASYMPYFISMVVVAGMVLSFTQADGIITRLYQILGGAERDLSMKPSAFPPIYVITTTWKSFGFSSILYLSTLTSIDTEQYEAARIDGANRWQQLLHVSLPGIIPVIAIQMILQLGKLMTTSTETILLLYNTSVYKTADTFGTYVYRDGIAGGNYSFASAVGIFTNVVNLTLVVISNTLSRKTLEFSLW